jgi:hypothetical protein
VAGMAVYTGALSLDRAPEKWTSGRSGKVS